MEEEQYIAKFKASMGLSQLTDPTGFVWNPGTEKQVGQGLVDWINKFLPKNFEIRQLSPMTKVELDSPVAPSAIETAPDKMVSDVKPKTKKK
jgi:hypothetical protein